MARLAGPRGRAVGIDVDDVKLRLAREEAIEQRIENVEFGACDVRAWEADAVYDVVYSRFLLTHLSDPAAVLGRMVQSTKGGGTVVVEDIDCSGIFSYPRCPALERHIALYRQVVGRRGGDPDIGPRLRELFVGAGLSNVGLQIVQPVFSAGEAKFIHSITTQSIADALVTDHIVTREEIDILTAELDAFAHDPNTLVGFPRIFQLWGQRRSSRRPERRTTLSPGGVPQVTKVVQNTHTDILRVRPFRGIHA